MLIQACSSCEDVHYEKHEAFFRQPVEIQHKTFRQMPVSQQVEIYLAARARHPPEATFCSDMAETTGASAVPVILAALLVERRDYEKAQLLIALECVADGRKEACDAKVRSRAREVAMYIREEFWRQEAMRALNGTRCPSE